jgi:hypothetical protein
MDTGMVKTLKPDYRLLLGPCAIIAVALLVGLCGQASARGIGGQGSMAGQSFVTSTGPAFVTGNLGSVQTTTIPGGGGQGFLMNNGNGTSTLITTGGLPQTIATPR